MKLRDDNGTAFELQVVGYQLVGDYQSTQPGRHPLDANWLIVEGRVQHPRGSWSFRYPCLTTFEVDRLARWFDGIADGKPVRNGCSFIEPNLEFCLAQGMRAIEVRLAHKCRPPWLGARERRQAGTTISFALQDNDPRTVAASLRELLLAYPER